MKFRIANPRRRRRMGRSACHKSAVRLAHCKYPRSSWHLGRKKMKTRTRSRRGRFVKSTRHAIKRRRVVRHRRPTSIYTKLRRKSYHTRLMRRRHRRSNPILALGNPRRSIRRHHRRRSNPPMKLGSFLNMEVIRDVFVGVGGFASARIVRDKVSTFYPANMTSTMEGGLNIAVKAGTAVLGGWLVSKWNKRAGRMFAIGAFTSAAWDLIALVTGKPMSLNEYVAPRATARNLRLGCGGGGCGGMGAYYNARGLRGVSGIGGSPSWSNK